MVLKGGKGSHVHDDLSCESGDLVEGESNLEVDSRLTCAAVVHLRVGRRVSVHPLHVLQQRIVDVMANALEVCVRRSMRNVPR